MDAAGNDDNDSLRAPLRLTALLGFADPRSDLGSGI
jgi:hypothetical protein